MAVKKFRLNDDRRDNGKDKKRNIQTARKSKQTSQAACCAA